jgi:tetratricopeptide (TPR) repeat protein
MAMSKSLINGIFAFVVVVLALTAGAFIYENSGWESPRPSPSPMTDDSLPSNRPPLDAEQRIAALEQMSARDPQNSEYLTQIANLHYDLGQFDKAVGFYERSLSIRPKDPGVETDLAVCYHYIGQHHKALETLDRVLAYMPGFPQALFNKGIILLNGKKDTKGSIAAWEELLRLNPNYAQRSELERKIEELKGTLK